MDANSTCDPLNATCTGGGFNQTGIPEAVSKAWSADGILAIGILLASMVIGGLVLYYNGWSSRSEISARYV